MSQSLIELAKELTVALIQTGNLPPQDVQETLQKTHTTLTALKALEASGFPAPGAPSQSPPGDWRKSITKYSITCLECGHAFKQLSIRHLRQHGLDARSYRTKYGIPQSQPLARSGYDSATPAGCAGNTAVGAGAHLSERACRRKPSVD